VAALVDLVDKKLLYLFTADSFTAPATSDYELSKQAIHHEIEWFFATTFKGSGTSPDRGTGEPVERDSLQPLVSLERREQGGDLICGHNGTGLVCAFGWLAHSRNSRLRLFTEDTPPNSEIAKNLPKKSFKNPA